MNVTKTSEQTLGRTTTTSSLGHQLSSSSNSPSHTSQVRGLSSKFGKTTPTSSRVATVSAGSHSGKLRSRPLPSKITDGSGKFTSARSSDIIHREGRSVDNVPYPQSSLPSVSKNLFNTSKDETPGSDHRTQISISKDNGKVTPKISGKFMSNTNPKPENNNNSNLDMLDSSDCIHVWVRHSIIASALSAPLRSTYGQSSNVNTSTQSTATDPVNPVNSNKNFSQRQSWSTNLNRSYDSSFTGTPTTASSTTPGNTSRSPLRGKSAIYNGRGRRIPHGVTAVSTSDDMSVSSQVSTPSHFSMSTSSTTNTNGGARTNSSPALTTSARWGWVKASLIHNDAHHVRKVNSSSNSSASSPEQKRWNGAGSSAHSSTDPPISTPSRRTKPPSPDEIHIPPPSSVTLEIIDLESEYHGKVLNIPLDSLPDYNDNNKNNYNNNNKNNYNNNSHRNQRQEHNPFNVSNGSVYGDGIVMANAWPKFTSIPTKNAKAKREQKQNTHRHASASICKPTAPKWATSRSGSKSFPNDKNEKDDDDNTSDNSDDLNAIPSDLTNLTHLHEPAVVYCLRNRYVMDEIYTSTGPILLALNPFKDVNDTYGENLMKKYWEKGEGVLNLDNLRSSNGTSRNQGNSRQMKTAGRREGEKLPPHVYAVADSAFRNMIRNMEDRLGAIDDSMLDQSILVSGESGAGKTVTTKIIMKYLAALSKRSSGSKSSKIKSITERTRASTIAGGSWMQGERGTHSTPSKMRTSPNSPTGKSTNIEQQVLESNPILESFGNARTIRNDNSSRFGKFIEIQFALRGKLVGASVDSYLLEKVRLINQSDGERNYHIFYELLAGANGSERKSLRLGTKGPQDFLMTTSESETYKRRDGVRDNVTFGALKKAMTTMGFNSEERLDILGIVSSLLHLSNITFQERGSNGCTLDDSNASLDAVLDLLRVGRNALDHALCRVNIEAGMEKVVKKLDLSQSVKAKEALIKATYGALFDYLVRRINSCINGQKMKEDNCNEEGRIDNSEGEKISSSEEKQLKSDAFIGVLDIFGFESFEENSFEQLCINYCNESLQQQFNKFVFKLEQAEYEKEGISWNFIAFPDNQDVLDLIHRKRTGILSILDEQSFLGQCTDQSLAQAIYQKCGGSGNNMTKYSNSNKNPFSASTQQTANKTFSIKHYAGPVEYKVTGFLEKNKDELPKETLELLLSSENSLLHDLATIMNTDTSIGDDGPSNRRVGKNGHKQNSLKRSSVGMQFSSQLFLLRKRIDATSPHYIRCLKPNDQLQPDNFDSAVIAEQLRCAGILEAVRVSRVGYPQRYSHERFVLRYQALAMHEMNIRRKDASTSFTSPVGFGGFHGSYNQRLTKEKKKPNTRPSTADHGQPRLSTEQECKILISVLARQLVEHSSSGEEENIAPLDTSWSEVKKRERWPQTSSSAKFQSPIRPTKKKELDLIKIGLQMGKTKVFLRQHAFEALELMRGRIKAVAATVITSMIRMFLTRRNYIIMRNEYRTRLRERSRMIQEANGQKQVEQLDTDYFQKEESAGSIFTAKSEEARLQFENMHISLHREPDYEGTKEFKWVWVDNRWVKNENDNDDLSSEIS